ncbi:MAG: prohibitin family protein [Deltaproteobacteria bacterium]|nr:prohibitin family protein [Deltaproteobacteria bacterium]
MRLEKATTFVFGVGSRLSALLRATVQATVLGIIETATSERGRRTLAVVALSGATVGLIWSAPIRAVEPGVVAVRVNRLTGGASGLEPGWAIVLPWVHELRAYPAGDRVYRPEKGERAGGSSPYQTSEGLSVGVDVTVRYSLDPENGKLVTQGLPDDLGPRIIEPVIDAILHRVLAKHAVREIYSTQRALVETEVTAELSPLLAPDGVVVRSVFLGRVDLPAEYRAGLEAALAEELSTEKMKYTLELKEKQVKEAELGALADKARRERAAEAAAQEEIIAARGREEAMKHILPLKEREIEQSRLEAEASRVTRLRLAETEAEARKIEAEGESAYRRKLAESDAYRIEITGKASSEQLARDASLISKNPLLIQKTLADKLSDKIQVIIAPPAAGGFFASGLLGQSKVAESREVPSEQRAPIEETEE